VLCSRLPWAVKMWVSLSLSLTASGEAAALHNSTN
jgi:hypothetical protein